MSIWRLPRIEWEQDGTVWQIFLVYCSNMSGDPFQWPAEWQAWRWPVRGLLQWLLWRFHQVIYIQFAGPQGKGQLLFSNDFPSLEGEKKFKHISSENCSQPWEDTSRNQSLVQFMMNRTRIYHLQRRVTKTCFLSINTVMYTKDFQMTINLFAK